MTTPQYAIKLLGNTECHDDFKYVENENGCVCVFPSGKAVAKYLIDITHSGIKPETVQPVRSIGICRKCGAPLFPSDLPGYESQCFECDEDFYSIEQELSDAQLARNDEIYNGVYALCRMMAEDEALEWNMEVIGQIADFAAELLTSHGSRVRFPSVVTEPDGSQYIEEYYTK